MHQTDIEKLSNKELKVLIADGGLSSADCTEKETLLERAIEANKRMQSRMVEVWNALSDEDMMEWIIDSDDKRLKVHLLIRTHPNPNVFSSSCCSRSMVLVGRRSPS